MVWYPRVVLWALVMEPSDSVCSMGPDFVHGMQLVCIGVQIRGPHVGPIGKLDGKSNPCWSPQNMYHGSYQLL